MPAPLTIAVPNHAKPDKFVFLDERVESIPCKIVHPAQTRCTSVAANVDMLDEEKKRVIPKTKANDTHHQHSDHEHFAGENAGLLKRHERTSDDLFYYSIQRRINAMFLALSII